MALLAGVLLSHPQQVDTLAPPQPSPDGTPGVTFEDITVKSGVATFLHRAGNPNKPYLPETLGSGVALFDYDNDGWLDIYLVNALAEHQSSQQAALFRNNHDGTFTDVTSRAGVGNGRWGTGVCAGDFDDDGWEDLFVTNSGKSRLYRNNRDGTFTDVAASAGVQVDTWATGCAFGDYNRDGHLDLYVAGYVNFDWDNPPPSGSGPDVPARTSSRLGQKTGAGAAYDPTQPFCTYKGAHVACGPIGLKGAPDFLFRNNGDGSFGDVTRAAGVSDTGLRYGMGVAWVDVDDDGWPDIVVANDSQPNFLYHNKRDGTFEEIGLVSGLGTNGDGRAQAYMGIAVGDYNHDGQNDVFFTTFSDDSYTLFRGSGRLDFSDVTAAVRLSRVTFPFLGWGTEFLDYDNDTWPDILTANGHVYPQANPAVWNTSYLQRTLLLRNLQGHRFADVSGNLGDGFTKPKSSRGAAVGDLFNDGGMDVVLNNLDSAPTVLRNHGANQAGHWLTLKLLGDPERKTPRDAIGTVVFCTAGGVRQRGEVSSGRSYLSQSDLRVHFGLGGAEKIDKLEIRWPNGGFETIEMPGVDRMVVIEQGKGPRK